MQRIPLGPLDTNRLYNRELTPYIRGHIKSLDAEGYTPQAINKKIDVPPKTISLILARLPQQQNGITRKRTGRPPTLSVRDRRLILHIVRKNPKILYQDLKSEAGVSYSHRTLYRILKDEGITNWICKKRPYLSEEVVKKRFLWVTARKDWSWEEWSKVIFSDECSVERGSGAQRQWAFRMPHEKWNKDMVQPYKKGKDISIMIWAAIWGGGKSNIVVMQRDEASLQQGYSANSYLAVLDDEIPRCYESDILFIQDNAPIHKAKIVDEWFKDHSMNVLDWPPYSLDINPIEHIWAELKQ